jgi:aminoglycoside phosphotransferase (APT) family kinase protein
VLLHDDLGGEHVLLDPEDGTVAAVIDWADASVGDPALDYAGLVGWLGEDFARRALDAASIAYDEDDLVRARFFATAVAIHSIALGRILDKPRWVAAGERMIRRVERR